MCLAIPGRIVQLVAGTSQLAVYAVPPADLLLAHDGHPQYRSTAFALEIGAAERRSVQHHRAHVASVLAERGAWGRQVLGLAFDGTGYGDDGTIWGGELLAGSVERGLERVGHLRPATLVGGDAAARHPVQAAAGFLAQLDGLRTWVARPSSFRPGTVRHGRSSGPASARSARRPPVGCSIRPRPCSLHPPGELRGTGGDVAGASRPEGA